tara:strand:- start:99 stop:443 length:345 start_codon:yes stop_codon:yes gene_type:complete
MPGKITALSGSLSLVCEVGIIVNLRLVMMIKKIHMRPTINETEEKIVSGRTLCPRRKPLVKAPVKIPKDINASKIGNNILPVSSSSLNVSTFAGGDTKPKNIPAGNARSKKVKY